MSDHENIQGIWEVISEEKSGLIIPIDQTRFGSKILYQLDPGREPKTIEFSHRRPRNRPRKKAQGVYLLQDNYLELCWVYDGPRPSSAREQDVQPTQFHLKLKRVRAAT